MRIWDNARTTAAAKAYTGGYGASQDTADKGLQFTNVVVNGTSVFVWKANPVAAQSGVGDDAGSADISGNSVSHNHGFTGTAATIDVMQPSLAIYIWKRTA